MRFSAYEIKKIFSSNFSDIAFLEDFNKMKTRYRENGIIIFYYYKNGEKNVIKYYSLQNVPDKHINQRIKSLNREYEFAKRVKHHPNIVNVYRHNKIRINGILIGIVMFMEFFSMTLKELIAKKGKFSDREIESFLIQMGSALETIHFKIPNPLIHCDIKPSNIGVKELSPENYHYKLMDFDVSIDLNENSRESMISSSTGYTPGYSPPEQEKAFYNREGELSNVIDIYSVGIIARQMLTGDEPTLPANNLSLFFPGKKNWGKVFCQLCNPDPNLRPKTINLSS